MISFKLFYFFFKLLYYMNKSDSLEKSDSSTSIIIQLVYYCTQGGIKFEMQVETMFNFPPFAAHHKVLMQCEYFPQIISLHWNFTWRIYHHKMELIGLCICLLDNRIPCPSSLPLLIWEYIQNHRDQSLL